MNNNLQTSEAPWRNVEFLPDKPSDEPDYGYIDSDEEEVSCSLKELQEAVTEDWKNVWYIWTPDSKKLLTVRETPGLDNFFLQERLKSGQRKLIFGLIGLIAAAAFKLIADHFEYSSPLLLMVLLVSLGIVPLFNGLRTFLRYRNPDKDISQNDIFESRMDYWMEENSGFYGGLFLVGFVAVMFLLQYLSGLDEALPRGYVNLETVKSGEIYRLLTSAMLHVNLVHFIVNASACYYLAKALATFWSPFGTVLVYLVTAITGSLMSIAISPETSMAGASGAICGIIGFLTVISKRSKQQLPDSFHWSMNFTVGIIVLVGLLGYDYISNSGHAGGFIGGIILGLLLWKNRPEDSKRLKILGILSGLVLLITGGYLGILMFS